MAVDVDSFTDTHIINGTLSHKVTITPSTEIDSVTYSVVNSTLSSEVSVDEVDYSVDYVDDGVEVNLKPHILRHIPTSSGTADVVITITDKYGRSVEVTDNITLFAFNDTFMKSSQIGFANKFVGDVPEYEPIYRPVLTGDLTNLSSTYIVSKLLGPVISGTTNHWVKYEYVNNGAFIVETSAPAQKVPNMIGGEFYIPVSESATHITFPIAKLENFIPSSLYEASIFNNLTNVNIFKYNPFPTYQASYLKLFTYDRVNETWDDRDYIRYSPSHLTAGYRISPTQQTYSNLTTNSECGTGSGLKGLFFSSEELQNIYGGRYYNGVIIPRFTDANFQIGVNGQYTTYKMSDYGVIFSYSKTDSTDATLSNQLYMYSDDISSIASSGDILRKAKGWTIVINPDLIDTGYSDTEYVGLLVDGYTNYNIT